MKLHYSQTRRNHFYKKHKFQYLMKLHYSQTCFIFYTAMGWFQYLMKLHYSQTRWCWKPFRWTFQYLMKLHYSQTNPSSGSVLTCFSTLWNYTTLKPCRIVTEFTSGFSTLWNYTTLKLTYFTSLELVRFSTLWNYTTLKPSDKLFIVPWVSVPYEITLLSNIPFGSISQILFQYLMKLHYSQTSNKLRHYNAQGNNIRYIYYTI